MHSVSWVKVYRVVIKGLKTCEETVANISIDSALLDDNQQGEKEKEEGT